MREYVKASDTDKAKMRSNFKLLSPSGKPPKLYKHSNDPDEFEDQDVDIPSIAAELTYNFSNYKPADKSSEEWVKIYTYPSRLSVIVDTIRYQVKFNRSPGIHPTLCCAMALGLSVLNSRRAIKKLGQINDSFRRLRKTGNITEVFIHDFLKSKVNCIVEDGSIINPKVTLDVKQQIMQISSDTGMSNSTTALLAIYAALIKQDETPNDYKESWQESFDDSMNILECKADAAKVMIHRLEQRYK